MTQIPETKTAEDLLPGDLIDLEGDAFADPNNDSPCYDCEYGVVAAIEHETPDCVRVDLEGGPSIGFPPSHRLTIGGHDKGYDI